MPENAERDRLKDLVTGQGQVLVEGSVDYAASASFSYLSHDGRYLVSVTRAAPDVPVAESAPKPEVKKAVPAPKPAAPKPDVKPVSTPKAAPSSPSRKI